MAVRLCLSGTDLFPSTVIGGAASKFLESPETVRHNLTAMCCGRAALIVAILPDVYPAGTANKVMKASTTASRLIRTFCHVFCVTQTATRHCRK